MESTSQIHNWQRKENDMKNLQEIRESNNRIGPAHAAILIKKYFTILEKTADELEEMSEHLWRGLTGDKWHDGAGVQISGMLPDQVVGALREAANERNQKTILKRLKSYQK